MKPLSELTRLGTIRRFRGLANKALGLYGINHAHLEFLTIAGNILFRVYERPQRSHGRDDDPFEPGQYLLRIHDSREQETLNPER